MCFRQRNAALHPAGIRAFRNHPRRRALDADFRKQRGERDAGPLAATDQTVAALDVGPRPGGPFTRAVAATLQHQRASDRRQPLDLRHRQREGAIDHAVNDQSMLRRIDRRDARMVPFVVQRRRRDRSHGRLKRSEAGTRLRRLRVPVPADRLLERRALTVRSQRSAEFPWRVPREQLLALGEKTSAEHRAHPKKLPSARPPNVVHRVTSRKIGTGESSGPELPDAERFPQCFRREGFFTAPGSLEDRHPRNFDWGYPSRRITFARSAANVSLRAISGFAVQRRSHMGRSNTDGLSPAAGKTRSWP